MVGTERIWEGELGSPPPAFNTHDTYEACLDAVHTYDGKYRTSRVFSI